MCISKNAADGYAVLKAVEAELNSKIQSARKGNITMKKIYGAYGSNLNLYQMARRCPFAQIYKTGFVEGYKLTFRRGGYCNIEKAEGEKVPVLLWKITELCERALDRYEGYPSFYVKENITVATEDGEEEAMFYIMSDAERGGYELPSVYYYQTVKDGYEDNALPMEYLETAFEECKAEVMKNMPNGGV